VNPLNEFPLYKNKPLKAVKSRNPGRTDSGSMRDSRRILTRQAVKGGELYVKNKFRHVRVRRSVPDPRQVQRAEKETQEEQKLIHVKDGAY